MGKSLSLYRAKRTLKSAYPKFVSILLTFLLCFQTAMMTVPSSARADTQDTVSVTSSQSDEFDSETYLDDASNEQNNQIPDENKMFR